MHSWNITLNSWLQQNDPIYFIIITINVSTISFKITEFSNCLGNLCQRSITSSKLKSRFYGLPSAGLAAIKEHWQNAKRANILMLPSVLYIFPLATWTWWGRRPWASSLVCILNLSSPMRLSDFFLLHYRAGQLYICDQAAFNLYVTGKTLTK